MSRQQNTIEELFWQAKQLAPGPMRQQFIAAIDQKDAGLANELRKLLTGDAAAERLFGVLSYSDAPSHSTAAENDESALMLDSCITEFQPPRESESIFCPATRIGPYKLLEPIGEGGMGLVYLAQQSEPVRRKVALKIIKPGMDSRQVIARFEAERQALALMDHPNIAKVLDAGTTATGLPYFVMELVRGIAITDYCDETDMSTNQRLKLFGDACLAIQHAHNKGIIHRDVKPTNVLVTEQDGQPLVKVIDFGIAKALTGNLTDKTMFTGMFQMLGTPLYTSPEQASLSNVDVDTRSDVYSLGVMLYQLLSGTLPIDHEEVKGLTFEELRKRICDTEPLRPSKRLSTVNEKRRNAIKREGVNGGIAERTIASELDWIVMQANNKDRAQRYQSPRQLAEDVTRYLNGDEVSACPPRLWYSAKRLAKKHRTSLLVASLIACTLIVATGVSVYWAVKATIATGRAEENLIQARTQKQKLAEFLYADDMARAVTLYRQGNHAQMLQAVQRHVEPERDYLRGFEWYFVRAIRPVSTQTIFQTDDRLNAFVLCDGGKTFVTGDSADRIFVVEWDSGRQLAKIDTRLEQVHDLEKLSDGRIIASGDGGKLQIYRWDRASGKLSLDQEMKVGDLSILSVAVGVQSDKCWVGSHDGTIFEVDLKARNFKAICKRFVRKQVRDLVLATDGFLIAGQSGDVFALPTNSTTLHDIQLFWQLTPGAPNEWTMDIEYASKTKRLVVGTTQGLVTVIDDASNGLVRFKHLLPRGIHSVAISADGQWIAAGDSEGRIHLFPKQVDDPQGLLDQTTSRRRRIRSWQAHTGKIEHLKFEESDADESIKLISAGRDGRVVASRPLGNLPVKFWNVPHNARFRAIESRLLWSRIGLEAKWLSELIATSEYENNLSLRLAYARNIGSVFVNVDGKEISRFNDSKTEAKKIVWRAPVDLKVDQMAASNDGDYLALCVRNVSQSTHSVNIYQTGHQRPLASAPSTLANDLVFSPDNMRLAYVHDNDIEIVHVETGRPLHTLSGHRDSIHSLAFSPDGKELASVSSDGRLIVWDGTSGKTRWVQQAHENRATAVAYHPTLNTIATVGDNAIVRFWSSRRQVTDDAVRLVGEFPLAEGGCSKLRFSKNGKSLFVFHAHRGVTELRSTY